jgi:hypothetical protein
MMADSVTKLFQQWNQMNAPAPGSGSPLPQLTPAQQAHMPRHGSFQQHSHPQADYGHGHGGGLHHSHSQNFEGLDHSSSQRGGLDSPNQNQHGRSPHQRMRKTHSEPNMPVADDSSSSRSHSSHHRGYGSSHGAEQRAKTAVTAVLFGYVGTRYHGLQKHDNVPTIEKDLESALIKAGAIVYAQVREVLAYVKTISLPSIHTYYLHTHIHTHIHTYKGAVFYPWHDTTHVYQGIPHQVYTHTCANT